MFPTKAVIFIIAALASVCVLSIPINNMIHSYQPAATEAPGQDPQQPATPGPTATPAAPALMLKTYTGQLKSGSSFFQNGQALVEIAFQDGRAFTAQEQLAASANMTIGQTYQITFNTTEPTLALKIEEIQ